MKIPMSAAFMVALILSACGDRNSPPPAPASQATPPPSDTSYSAPVIPSGTAEEVTKKGTSTGMVGGEAGTVASSGKPGTGTSSGAGTGAAQSSDSKTTDKK